MYVCMYICVYVCKYICMYVSMYVCMHVYMCICMKVYMYLCIMYFLLNTFIYQHAPLLMSNTTCIFISFTYYDLSCLYIYLNIYCLLFLCSSFQFILSTYSLNFFCYCTPNLLQLTGKFSVLVTTAFSFSLSFSRRGQSYIICCTVCRPFMYVCMYVCMYVSMYVCMYVCIILKQ